MSRMLIASISACLLFGSLFWSELINIAGLSQACPVLMRQGAHANALSSAANALGARWTLPAYTRSSLKSYVGETEGLPILLAMNGDVFDVSAGRKFYGPKSGYRIFAGVDATRSLSTGSLEPSDAEAPKWNDLSDFNDKGGAWDTLLEQHAFYGSKYGRVGRLVEEDGSDAAYLLPDGTLHQGPLAKADVDTQRNRNNPQQASEL